MDRSKALADRARRVIPGGSQTFSKGPSQFVRGVAPSFLSRGRGSHVWDVDGNEYIDFSMALGPILLGYAYPAVQEAVSAALEAGPTFSLPHPLEVEVAELLAEAIPCAEMVRFSKNGSDATAGAVRLARAHTGRDVIACCGYHGGADWFLGTTPRAQGVPESVRAQTRTFGYNDMESLERIFSEHPGQVAAVILEPVGVIEPRDDFLKAVAERTRCAGAVLIFDEVVTGFRLGLGGAQQHFGVTPDLACFGKGMANGFPLAALVGRREIMRKLEEVFFSFTFGGETLSLAAAQAVIREIRSRPVADHLWRQGRALQDGYNRLAKEFGLEGRTACVGLPPRTVLTFCDERGEESLALKSLFQQECIRRGILLGGGHNLCYSHSDGDIQEALRVYREGMEILAEAVRQGDAEQRLEGPAVQPIFRRA